MQCSAWSDRTVTDVRLIVRTNQQLKKIIVGLCAYADRGLCLWLLSRFSLSAVFSRWHVKLKIVRLPCCILRSASRCTPDTLNWILSWCVEYLPLRIHADAPQSLHFLSSLHFQLHIQTHFISLDSRSQCSVTCVSGIPKITLLRWWDDDFSSCANSLWVRHSSPAFFHRFVLVFVSQMLQSKARF